MSLYGLAASDISDGSFTNSMGAANPSDDGDPAVGLRVFAGFDLSPRLAVEVAYAKLGESDVRAVSNGCCVWAAGDVTASVEYSGLEASVIAQTDIGRWRLGGRLGLFVWSDSFEARDSAGTYKDSDTGASPAVGIIASRDWLRLELTHYAVEHAVTTVTAGFTFRP